MGQCWLEDHVEIQSEESAIVAKEDPGLWIGDVAVNIQRIEVIGQIETAHRKAESVFRADLKIARNFAVKREKFREAQTVGFADVLLFGIQ